MKMTAYIHIVNGEMVTSARAHPPEFVVCECPKVDGEWIADLSVLIVDQENKTAKVDNVKLNEKKQARLDEIAADAAKKQAVQTEIDEIRDIDWTTANNGQRQKIINFLLKKAGV